MLCISTRLVFSAALICVLFLGQSTALPAPKCDIGYGVTVKYEDAKYGECKKCKVPNCQYCLYDYKSCDDEYAGPGCKPGYGLNSKKNKCLPCKGSRCGVCENNYKKCTRKVADCDKKVTKVMDAEQVSVKNITNGRESCFKGKPYFNGNGYTSRFVPLIKKNGVCVDCNSDSFRFLGETGKDFCYLDGLMREVAVNAFKKDPKCDYPEDVSLRLTDFCFNSNRGLQFSAVARYKGKYCGKSSVIYVEGATEFGPDVYKNVPNSITWTYATK
jgi:hypothetical protein